AVSEVVTDTVDWAMQAPLRNRFRDLPEADIKEILHQRMWESESYKSHEDHMQLFEGLEKSMNRDHSEERPATPEPAWSIRSSDVPTNDIATFMDWFCKRRGITELKPQDMEGPAYEIIKVFHPGVIHLQYQMEECHKLLTDSVDDPILSHNVSKPLPLGGPPVKRIGELEHIMVDLIQVNKNMEEILDSHGSRLYTLEQLDIPQ
nr:hypothetical protein [Tanacetum cinerariifolium]